MTSKDALIKDLEAVRARQRIGLKQLHGMSQSRKGCGTLHQSVIEMIETCVADLDRTIEKHRRTEDAYRPPLDPKNIFLGAHTEAGPPVRENYN